MLSDAETGELIEINTHDARKRRAFAERRAKHQADLFRLLRSANIDTIEARAGEPYAAALGQFFRNARKTAAPRQSMNTNSALIIPAQSPAATNAASAGFSRRSQAADRDSQRLALGLLDCRHPALLLAAAGWRGAIGARRPLPSRRSAGPAARARAAAAGCRRSRCSANPSPFPSRYPTPSASYLEERFDFHAPERTTEEFLYELQGTNLLTAAQKQSLADFLASCDLIKFAKYEPTETELRALARRRSAPCQRNRTAV